MGALAFDVKAMKYTYGAAIPNVVGTPDVTYSSNEQTLLADLVAATNAILAALRAGDQLSQP